MTNQNDSFIDEVTEDLRRDRLFLLMRRYGWIVILLIVGLVGASAWREYSQSRARAEAEAFGDALIAADSAAAGDAAKRAEALAALNTEGAPGRAALAAMMAADAQAEAGNPKAAVDLLAKAEAAAGDDHVMRDLARLKSVLVQGPAMEAAARDAMLADLSKPGAPFELLALEQKAVALADAGRREDALALIGQIQQKDGLSQSLRMRLAELTIVLGGDPEPETAPAASPTPAAAPADAAPAEAAAAKPAN